MKLTLTISQTSESNLALTNMSLAEIMAGVTPSLMSQYKIEDYFGAPQGNEIW